MRVKHPGRTVNQPPGDPAAQLADAVRQAKPVMAVLSTDAHAASAAVDGCLALLSDDPIRVVRVRGLPGAPLTLSRIVEEIGANHRDGPRADDDELIVRVLATRSRGEAQVVLLLEQAELLPLPTLAFLQVALTVFGARTPRLQLLFAGHPKFMPLVDRDELAPLRDRLGPVIRVQPALAGPGGPVVPRRAELGRTAPKRRTVAGLNRRQWVFAAVPALMLAAAAATLGRSWHGAARPSVQAPPSAPPAQVDPSAAQPLPRDVQPPLEPALPPQAAEPKAAPAPPSREPDVAAPPPPPPDREPDVAVAPATPQPPPPGREPDVAVAPATPQPSPSSRQPDMAATPPERRALPSSEQLTRLRSEFDRFLSQTEWGSKKLSENERSRLFNEYLRWNYGALAATPGAQP